MDFSNEIRVGQVVKSKAGRDKGRLFIVYKVLDISNVYTVDGDLRTVEKPKLKKLKHLYIMKKVVPNFEEMVLDGNLKNSDIRKILQPFKDKDTVQEVIN